MSSPGHVYMFVHVFLITLFVNLTVCVCTAGVGPLGVKCVRASLPAAETDGVFMYQLQGCWAHNSAVTGELRFGPCWAHFHNWFVLLPVSRY